MDRALLKTRFASDVIILDGATGTELTRRGVSTTLPLWSAAALLTHPGVVEAIHRDYVVAGAEIIVANTFRTNVRTLRAAGLLDRAPEMNRRAIELARRAAQSKIQNRKSKVVAASIAPVEDCYHAERVPDYETLLAEHWQMMLWL